MNLKLSYDGHGLNVEGGPDERSDGLPLRDERLITWQRKHRDQGGDYVVSDDLARELGPVLAAAPDLLAALVDLRKEPRAHVKFDVKRHYSLMVADVCADKAIAKAKGER